MLRTKCNSLFNMIRDSEAKSLYKASLEKKTTVPGLSLFKLYPLKKNIFIAVFNKN